MELDSGHYYQSKQKNKSGNKVENPRKEKDKEVMPNYQMLKNYLTEPQKIWNLCFSKSKMTKWQIIFKIFLQQKQKRKIKKLCQTTRDPNVKKLLNRASNDLKSTLQQIENK